MKRKGTLAPKGSCKELENEFDVNEFVKNTLLFGAIITVIGLILLYLNII